MIRVVKVRSPNLIADVNAIIDAQIEVRDRFVKPELSAKLVEVSHIDKWQGAIEIAAETGGTREKHWLDLVPSGDEHNINKWLWVSKGTQAHKIPASPKPPGTWLKFRWGGPGSYRPITTPKAGPIRLAGGQSLNTVYRKQVDHPGIEPREFEQRAAKAYDLRLFELNKLALDQGIKRAVELGR